MSSSDIFLRKILRILTLEEMNDLTIEFDSLNKVSLANLLRTELEINDLKKNEDEVIEDEKKLDQKSPDLSSSSRGGFIIMEREKIKKNEIKLKRKELLKLYGDANSVDINRNNKTSKEKGHEFRSANLGILVNKKEE